MPTVFHRVHRINAVLLWHVYIVYQRLSSCYLFVSTLNLLKSQQNLQEEWSRRVEATFHVTRHANSAMQTTVAHWRWLWNCPRLCHCATVVVRASLEICYVWVLCASQWAQLVRFGRKEFSRYAIFLHARARVCATTFIQFYWCFLATNQTKQTHKKAPHKNAQTQNHPNIEQQQQQHKTLSAMLQYAWCAQSEWCFVCGTIRTVTCSTRRQPEYVCWVLYLLAYWQRRTAEYRRGPSSKNHNIAIDRVDVQYIF